MNLVQSYEKNSRLRLKSHRKQLKTFLNNFWHQKYHLNLNHCQKHRQNLSKKKVKENSKKKKNSLNQNKISTIFLIKNKIKLIPQNIHQKTKIKAKNNHQHHNQHNNLKYHLKHFKNHRQSLLSRRSANQLKYSKTIFHSSMTQRSVVLRKKCKKMFLTILIKDHLQRILEVQIAFSEEIDQEVLLQ